MSTVAVIKPLRYRRSLIFFKVHSTFPISERKSCWWWTYFCCPDHKGYTLQCAGCCWWSMADLPNWWWAYPVQWLQWSVSWLAKTCTNSRDSKFHFPFLLDSEESVQKDQKQNCWHNHSDKLFDWETFERVNSCPLCHLKVFLAVLMSFAGDLVCPPYYELCDSTVPYIPGACPHACNLNGECINGECHCFLGFSGEYCNQRKSVHLWLPSISHMERLTIWRIRFLCACWQLCFCIVSSCVAWVFHEKLVISSCEPFNSVTSEIFWSCLIWPE